MDEGEIVRDGVDISSDAREELVARHMETLHDRDDFEFTSQAGASRRTGFDQSVGNSTNKSWNSKRHALLAKDQAVDNANMKNQNADLYAQMQEQAERIRALEAALAATQHGSPPVSGSAPPGNDLPSSSDQVGQDGGAQG